MKILSQTIASTLEANGKIECLLTEKRCYKALIELMNWKSIINIIKNSMGSVAAWRLKTVSESKDRTIKIVQSEHQKEKDKQSLSGL